VPRLHRSLSLYPHTQSHECRESLCFRALATLPKIKSTCRRHTILSVIRNKHRSLVVLGTATQCCRQTSLKWLIITTRKALTILLTSRVHLSCASSNASSRRKDPQEIRTSGPDQNAISNPRLRKPYCKTLPSFTSHVRTQLS